ncbi:sensor histidine kinase [Reinekea thalattae]|uniref:histidine kinase n=1 Tax=Reinekea thalattae TaxID=2593301 RepID=A0A5C8Z9H5_9GAMM|nr:HAMP domain-containing sensor histidine kinase [Reinekea thalattae]TXR54387.1 HAMP domain-containing histidine kinase [Reinekea thalattae]
MKIRLSLRLYFIIATILLVSVISIALSLLSIENLSRGINFGAGQTMGRIGTVEGVSDGQPVEILGFHVASRLQDLPEAIQKTFEHKNLEANTIEKKIIRSHFLAPPRSVYVLLKIKTKTGEDRFIAAERVMPKSFSRKPVHAPPSVWILVFGVLAPLIFLAGLIFIISRVASPVEALKNWAKNFNVDTAKKPVPDFQYKELNSLAHIVRSSLASAHEALDREQKFLAHASHELRTPISVVRANTELLKKIPNTAETEQKRIEVLDRIERAGKTMTSLTETLLWLSRDSGDFPADQTIRLDLLIEELVSDLNYLVDKKEIELMVKTEPYELTIAAVPCRIVIANLVRNAFQHTISGKVSVVQQGTNVCIMNSSQEDLMDEADLGFGLGLRLSRELAQKYHWQYEDKAGLGRYEASIRF